MKVHVSVRLKALLLTSFFGLLVSVSCVEKQVTDGPTLNLNQELDNQADKFDLDRIVNGIQGTWVQECGITDTQRITWNYSESRYTQKIEIFLDKSCPDRSIAVEFEVSGTYQLGEVLSDSKDTVEINYVQDSNSMTIHHKSYQDAYNAVREYRDLPSFCENHWFEQGQKVNLIGKSCLNESNRYQKILPQQSLFSSIKVKTGELWKANYSQLLDGSSPKNRAVLSKNAFVYAKAFSKNQIKMSKKYK